MKVNTDDIQAGMILAQSIYGSHGELLIPAGAKLIEQTVKFLQARGIASVTIEGEDTKAPQFTEEQINEQKEQILTQFSSDSTLEGALWEQLLDAVALYQLQKNHQTEENLT